MTGLEIVIPIVAILVGGAVVLLPLSALAVRFAIKPLVESYVRARESGSAPDALRSLEHRVSLLEEQIERVERDTSRLSEASEFHRRLEAPES